MATNVMIKYVGRAAEIDRKGMEIARFFAPNNSYIDSPVYTEGYDPTADGNYADGEAYGRSIYATNVYGHGELPGLLPMAHTTVKFAQFEIAKFYAFEAEKAGEENPGVEFEVDGYEEKIYWKQMCRQMVEEGFYSKVGDEEFGEDSDDEGGDDEGGD